MNTNKLIWMSLAALAMSAASTSHAQVAVPAAPTPTIWRFMGIPQGFQKIRDVTVNRRGNHPGMERKPPLKRIGDPANLESENPAIKAAAEIKQAEDMKAQKIKAIKFLAEMGCGCYDKEGKITDALIAAMDDCTPDVRLASIEAIETTASGECCKKCGSTTCCSEKVTKRLSEIAYERDDTGCYLEPNAEIREAAARAMKVCCPNVATGPIEEDVEEQLPVPVVPEEITGEGEIDSEGIQGEGGGDESILEDEELKKKQDDAAGADDTVKLQVSPSDEPVMLLQSAEAKPPTVEVGKVKMIGGMAIQPVTISPVVATEDTPEGTVAAKPERKAPSTPVALSFTDKPSTQNDASSPSLEKPVSLPAPIALPKALPIEKAGETPAASHSPQTIGRKKVVASVIGVDHRTGRVMLRSGQAMRAGSSVTVYHQYLTGERLIAHLLIRTVNGSQAIAMVTDPSVLSKIESGDRALCY